MVFSYLKTINEIITAMHNGRDSAKKVLLNNGFLSTVIYLNGARIIGR
ncbi:hypothetical protein [Methanobrevibacter sp.]|nr:hypothetical protein [Methanobrevibacter sp.]MBQ6512600.1 hypothetical protein [Methanobrevibacter sp.]